MNKSSEVRIIRRYSEGLKRQLVGELESGQLTVREAMSHYDIPCRRTINYWRQAYGKVSRKTRVVRVIMKSELEKIRELESAFAEERLRSRLFAAQLEEYEILVPDLKKKLNAEQLKKFEENERKIAKLR